MRKFNRVILIPALPVFSSTSRVVDTVRVTLKVTLNVTLRVTPSESVLHSGPVIATDFGLSKLLRDRLSSI